MDRKLERVARYERHNPNTRVRPDLWTCDRMGRLIRDRKRIREYIDSLNTDFSLGGLER